MHRSRLNSHVKKHLDDNLNDTNQRKSPATLQGYIKALNELIACASDVQAVGSDSLLTVNTIDRLENVSDWHQRK